MSDTVDPEIQNYWADIGVDTSVIENAGGVTSTPYKLVPELAVSTSSSFDIVAVINNKDTVRVNWESLTADYVRSTADIPTPGITTAPYATIATDNTGAYISTGEQWLKIPAYSDNWDDLTSGTRFLLVNAPMELSAQEIANARTSLGLFPATDEELGLIKSSNTIHVSEDGTASVAFAKPVTALDTEGTPGLVYLNDSYSVSASLPGRKYAVTENYVSEALTQLSGELSDNLPVASTTSRGIVQIAEADALKIENGVLSTSIATANSYGVVSVKYGDNESTTGALVTSQGYVDERFNNLNSALNIRIAGPSVLGMVKVADDSNITIDQNGFINVQVATETSSGVVRCVASEIKDDDAEKEDENSVVVNRKAVIEYVKDKINHIPENLTPATADTLGSIKVGSGLTIDQTGVLSLVNATANSIGGVTVVSAGSTDTAPFRVPSVAAVEAMVNSSGVSVSQATDTRLGTVKLGDRTPVYSTDNYSPVRATPSGQLYVEKASISGSMPVATSDTLGAVVLSSFNTLIGGGDGTQGLSIAGDNSGRIYVDCTDDRNKADTFRYGLVKLSTNATVPITSAAIGVDANGCLRAEVGSGTSGSSYVMANYNTDSSITNDNKYAQLGYFDSGDTQRAVAPGATADRYGVVKLGSDIAVDSGIPVGADNNGRLAVALSLSGTSLSTATVDRYGIVKLGTSSTVTDSGLPVGVDKNGRLRLESSSTSIQQATTSVLGGVKLSQGGMIQDSAAMKIGLNSQNQLVADKSGINMSDASNSNAGVVKLSAPAINESKKYAPIVANTYNNDRRIVVPAADLNSDSYGAVKVKGTQYTAGSNYSLVGLDPDGYLAIGGTSLGGGSPFHVTLTPYGTPGTYRITMTGGSIQMNDGTIVNVAPITERENKTIIPEAGSVLNLTVVRTSTNSATAKITQKRGVNVLTCNATV